MKRQLLNYLVCPLDRQSPLRVEVNHAESDEIDAGRLWCDACAVAFPIVDGIPSLMRDAGQTTLKSSEQKEQEGAGVTWKRQEIEQRDKEAATYDTDFADVLNIDTTSILKRLQVRPQELVLDAGSGTGLVSLALAKAPCEVLAVDFSRASLLIQQRKLKSNNGQGLVHLIHADLDALPIRSGIVQSAVSSGVLHHLPGLRSKPQAVREIARVLVKGAIFISIVYNYSALRAFILRVFPGLQPIEQPYIKEGFHSGRIYFYCFTGSELKDVFGQVFDVEYLVGIRNLPKVMLRWLGRWAAPVDRVLQRLPWSLQTGATILAKCKK